MKNIVITGGTRGIGFSIAEKFLKDGGYNVIITGTNQSSIDNAIKQFKQMGLGNYYGFMFDNAVDGDYQKLMDFTFEVVGPIDILVNNAGIGGGGKTAEFSFEQWENMISVNLSSVFKLSKTVLENKNNFSNLTWGRIINIASTGGKQGVVFAACYSASKHGVVGFSKALGLELSKTGITVNAVCPGFVETDLAVGARERYAKVYNQTVEEVKQNIENRVPIGRYINPEEVADLVFYIASESANGITAQAVNVCGGLGNY